MFVDDEVLSSNLRKLESLLLTEIVQQIESGMEAVDLSSPKDIKRRKEIISLWSASLNLCRAAKAYRSNTNIQKDEDHTQEDLVMAAKEKLKLVRQG